MIMSKVADAMAILQAGLIILVLLFTTAVVVIKTMYMIETNNSKQPCLADNNPILPWLSSSPTKVVSMSTQTGAGSNTGSRDSYGKGAEVDADYEAVRSEVQENADAALGAFI